MKTIIIFIMSLMASISSAQNLGGCSDIRLDFDEMKLACKKIINDAKRPNWDVALAARNMGMLLTIEEAPSTQIINYFLISAEKGYLGSYSHIADLYRNGYKGVKIDYKRALYYYEKDSEASIIRLKGVGNMYLNGLGVEKDINKGIFNYMLVAYFEEGNAEIRSELCKIYADDKYMRKDLVLAYYWCATAVHLESSFMKSLYEDMRYKVFERLDANQLSRANKLIETCKNMRGSCFDQLR